MTGSVSHRLAVALAIIPLAASLIVLLITLVFGFGIQCDESCTGEDWHHTADAWQWKVQPLLGAIVSLSGLAFFYLVNRRRPGSSFVALALGALVTFLGAAWTGGNWRDSLERHPPVMALLAIILCSGVLATLLCTPTERDGRARDRTG